MAPDAPTCQLLLKWELKGAQKGLEFLPPPREGRAGDSDSGNEKGRKWVLKDSLAGAPWWAEEPEALRWK